MYLEEGEGFCYQELVISLISLFGFMVELSLPEKGEDSSSKLFILKPISETLGNIFLSFVAKYTALQRLEIG